MASYYMTTDQYTNSYEAELKIDDTAHLIYEKQP